MPTRFGCTVVSARRVDEETSQQCVLLSSAAKHLGMAEPSVRRSVWKVFDSAYADHDDADRAYREHFYTVEGSRAVERIRALIAKGGAADEAASFSTRCTRMTLISVDALEFIMCTPTAADIRRIAKEHCISAFMTHPSLLPRRERS